MRRRLAFATPFVLAIACKRPVERGRDPEPPVARDASALVDVPPDAARAVDAYLMTAEDVAVLCAKPGAHCNPPPPARDTAVDAAPAPPIEGTVVAVERGTGKRPSVVTVAIGERDGVLRSSRGTLVDGAAILGTFTILRLNATRTIGYTDVPPGQITGETRVRFSPPDTN